TWEGRVETRASLIAVALDELPSIDGKVASSFVRGRLSGTLALEAAAPTSLRAGGKLTLDDATFPVIDLTRPTLARYGLRPPNEDAAMPVTAVIVGTDAGVILRDLAVTLRGASVHGRIAASRAGVLNGLMEVTLEEEYLRTSKVMTLPRVFTE